MTFKNGEDFYEAIKSGDFYNEESCLYVFLYNEAGAVCVYSIQNEEREVLEYKSKKYGEYWGAFLGIGGEIYDDPTVFCNEEYNGDWIRV